MIRGKVLIGVRAGRDKGSIPQLQIRGINPTFQAKLHAKLFSNVQFFYECPMSLCMAAGK